MSEISRKTKFHTKQLLDHSTDRSPSPSPSSSSGSSSMFPSANIPTSPPPAAVLSGTTAIPPTASSINAAALNNLSTPPDSQAQTQAQNQPQNQAQGSDSTLPSHLRTTNSTPVGGSASADSGVGVGEDVHMADAPSSSAISPITTMNMAGLKRERPTSKGNAGTGGGGGSTISSILASADEDEHAPGYAWRNKRAVEEMQKAMEVVLDRDFTLKEFGDPVLEQIQAEKQAVK